MEYRLLTDAHRNEIRQQKLLDLEVAHARLTLDLAIVDRQIEALVDVRDNGQREVAHA